MIIISSMEKVATKKRSVNGSPGCKDSASLLFLA